MSNVGASDHRADATAHLVVICEGQTEEEFVTRSICPVLAHRGVLARPITLNTSTHRKGGDVKFARLLPAIRNTLRERQQPFVTTLIDWYQLATDFPGYAHVHGHGSLAQRLHQVRAAVHQTVANALGEAALRFHLYIQAHEFEALLFTDIGKLAEVEPLWRGMLGNLEAIASQVESPEHINHGPESHPAKHLERALARPRYQKRRHGPVAAEKISLVNIEAKCQHFAEWMDQMRQLAEHQSWR